MKRLLLFLSAFMIPITALWAHDVEIDGIYYNLDDASKTAEVTYKGDSYINTINYSGIVVIPETITYNSETYNIRSIGNHSFYDSGLTSVTIPNSVTSIGHDAFSGCRGLTSVTIPNNVTSIGSNAFERCVNLTSVIWNAKFFKSLDNYYLDYYGDPVNLIDPFYDIRSQITSFTFGNEVKSIPDYLCYEMNNLKEITITNSVISIGDGAFRNCSGLTSVTIPNSVTSIGDRAFSHCSGLTSVTIPNSVTSIGHDAFSGCSVLTKVNYLGTVDEWAEIDFYSNPASVAEDLYINDVLLKDVKITSADSIKKNAFRNCQSIKSVEIGESVTSIGDDAFYNCDGLISVTIPNNVTSIGDAFSYCSSLSSVVWNAKNCPDFTGKYSKLYNEFICDAPFYNIRSQITSFTFGNDVEHIPAYLCYGMYNLKDVTIGNNVKSIGDSPFSGCSVLSSVVWNVKNSIGFISSSKTPFYNIRSQITSFTFGNDVEHIPAYLCYEMSNLKEVTIGNSVTSIGSYTFDYCNDLTKVNYLGTVDKWVEIDFKNPYSNPISYAENLYINDKLLTDVRIISADSIKDYAFYRYQSIKSVEMGNSVTSIGEEAFYNCSGLNSVTIGNSVTSIEEAAFSDCSNLTKVNYLGTVDTWAKIDFKNSFYLTSNPTYYAKDLYINDELLTELKITSADSIKKYAFYNCQSIKSIEIGNSVTSIGNDAFSRCSSLTSVIWNARNLEFSSYSFDEIRYQITTFTFGNEVEYIPSYLCYEMNNLKEIIIPNSVTSIGYDAFRYCSGLTSVTIGENVTSIRDDAFDGCYNITSVIWNAKNCNDFDYNEAPFYSYASAITSFTFGEKVEHIPANLCRNMSDLKEITIPSSVLSIGDDAFYECDSLNSVIWNAKNCDNINKEAHPFVDLPYYCSNITSFTFGDEVEHIPAYLCYGMSNLKEITVSNVTSIGDRAFYDCANLNKVYYTASVNDWLELNFTKASNNPIYYADNLYINNELLTDLEITSVDSINDYAFYNCKSIKTIEIGDNVISIGDKAFYECNNLSRVNYLGSVDKWINFDFTSATDNPTYYAANLYINDKLLTDVNITSEDSIKNYAFYNCKSIKSVETGKSVTSIGTCAFDGCKGLTSVSLGNSVTSLGYEAFSDCTGLISVTIPNSVTSIGEYAFYKCSNLKKVINFSELDIVKGETTHGYVAYYADIVGDKIDGDFVYDNNNVITEYIGDINVIKIEIPLKAKGLYDSVLKGCSQLDTIVWNANDCFDIKKHGDPFNGIRHRIKSFIFSDEVEHIPAYLCNGMYRLNEITIPNKVASIDSYTFSGCSGLTLVNIPNSVMSINDYAFSECTGLSSVIIGSNVTSIGSYAFSSCSSLTTVNIPDNVNSINNYAFSECTGLSSVIIGNNVTSIDSYSFENCSNLTSVTLGERVRTIAQNAFSGCDRLRKVIAYPTSVPSVYKNSFAHYNAALYVPCDVYDEYYYDEIFGSFKETKCIAAEEVDEVPEKVEIEVDENNNATVIWPSTGNAKSYELEIAKDGDVFCTLLFNENGQLTSVDFGNRSASVGFQFTVTGLDGASKYSYSMVALDKKGNELQSYKGTFTTSGYNEETAILETLADANITISDGLITCQDAEFTIYNTLGQDVTNLNGALTPGVYVVSIADDVVKVMVK